MVTLFVDQRVILLNLTEADTQSSIHCAETLQASCLHVSWCCDEWQLSRSVIDLRLAAYTNSAITIRLQIDARSFVHCKILNRYFSATLCDVLATIELLNRDNSNAFIIMMRKLSLQCSYNSVTLISSFLAQMAELMVWLLKSFLSVCVCVCVPVCGSYHNYYM